MARRAKTTPVTGGEIVGSTFEEKDKVKGSTKTSDTVLLAVCLPHGLIFDDVPCGNGNTKTIVFPGLNDSLRTKREGILIGAGNAIAFRIDRTDWENIQKMHGREAVFTGVNGGMPCIIEMKDKAEFNARRDEIAEVDHGLNPIQPESVNVKEVKTEE